MIFHGKTFTLALTSIWEILFGGRWDFYSGGTVNRGNGEGRPEGENRYTLEHQETV